MVELLPKKELAKIIKDPVKTAEAANLVLKEIGFDDNDSTTKKNVVQTLDKVAEHLGNI